MEIYPDEKWIPSNKEQSSRSRSRRERLPEEAGPDRPACLRRSTSTIEERAVAPAPVATPRSFSRRCSGIVKEQRAKFYIVRRCVSMLMCWRERLD
ncbi:hypothetical protein ZIOFF_036888 [Zingiber officinale]|uniref:Uncharacterized protein n=1 Tax=Zingiber officinale TaxID=94328 RepID=A0A8J5GHU8_ZINOF|nr:hypothetical protein ZIOFF_036888 [Zingiber officinale]